MCTARCPGLWKPLSSLLQREATATREFRPRRPSVNILKRIPPGIPRPESARKLAAILDKVTTDNNAASWDGATVMLWKTGRVLVRDVTCMSRHLCPSHILLVTREAGAVAAQAEQWNCSKYSELEASHHFVPVAIETAGVSGPEALHFLRELAHCLKAETGEPRSLQFLGCHAEEQCSYCAGHNQGKSH